MRHALARIALMTSLGCLAVAFQLGWCFDLSPAAAGPTSNKRCTPVLNPCEDCDDPDSGGEYYCTPTLDPGFTWGSCQAASPAPFTACLENINSCGPTRDCMTNALIELGECENRSHDTCKQSAAN